MLSEELVDIATRHQVYLERYKAGLLKATDPLFQRLNREIMAVLNELKDADLSVLTELERVKLVADIREGNVAAYKEHLDALILQLRDLADYSREFELESIDTATIDAVEPDDSSAPALWPAVIARPMSATGKLLAAWLGAWMGNEVTRSEDIVRRAIAEGWTVARLATAFRGTKAGDYKNGLFGSARRNTATTINTAVQHVSATSRAHTMEHTVLAPKGATGKNGPKVNAEGQVTSIPRAARQAAERAGIKVGTKVRLMGYRWISILDSVTSQTCRSLDQQVFEFNKGPLPPAHPNCRSSIIAEIIGQYLKRGPSGRFVKRDERTAVGAKGVEKVDGTVKYYEWLKSQPPEFQNDALGVTRAELFRKGGMSAATFARLNLGRNFQPLTLDEMRKLKPNAFRRAGL